MQAFLPVCPRIMAVRACRLLALVLLSLHVTRAQGAVWNVSTVAELNHAVANYSAGDEIVMASGTYPLSRALWLHRPGVTVRGGTGNREDVVLVGGGMNARGVDEGISVGADDIAVRDLTLAEFYFNGIHTRAENDVDRTVISNVKTLNIGERHIKGSRDPNDSAKVSNDILIENCLMLQTKARSGHPDTNPDYIGGIDMMMTSNLTIRGCVAQGIHGSNNGGNAAIFLWQGHRNVTIECNRIVACAKGIALGNPAAPSANLNTGPWHADTGVIRNNFVLRGVWTGGNNIGLELCSTKNVRVYNNTIYSENASYFRTVSIYDCSPDGLTQDVILGHNLIRGRTKDYTDGSGWTETGNLQDGTGAVITAAWFADPGTGDFHLTPFAGAAVDAGVPVPEVTTDIDGDPRPQGSASDIGADERLVAPTPPHAPTNLQVR
ncbi:MAG: hypothetical protein JXR37_32355 [Kiritimatiellae bacterium]|nr:hypothetical protein [Kiritimatiellia bacterium]